MVIDGGKCPGGIESTVIDLSGEKTGDTRRAPIPIEKLRKILPDIITFRSVKIENCHRSDHRGLD